MGTLGLHGITGILHTTFTGAFFSKKRILILNLADFYSSFAYVMQWLSDKQATGNKLTNGDVLPEANLKQQTYWAGKVRAN